MTTTRTFTHAELEDLELPRTRSITGTVTIIRDTIVDTGRWHTTHELIFQLPQQGIDDAWLVYYNRPATECQECDTWDDDPVTATLVHRTTQTVEVWE